MTERAFIIRCAANAVISERWRVMAISPEQALQRFEDGHESLAFEEQIGCDDEENRRDFEVEEAGDQAPGGLMPFTVVWRPGCWEGFRGDTVEAASEDVEAVMAAAFDVVRAEMREEGASEEDIAALLGETYDLCAILRGHAGFIY